MNNRKVRMHQAEILRNAGHSQREIAEQLGVSDRMVRYYLTPQKEYPVTTKISLLDPYREYITSVLEDAPNYNLEVLKRDLVRRGYTGGMTILRVYAKTVRDAIVRQAVIRFETSPGQQAQVDWKEAGTWELNGEKHKVYAFVMLLGYSRRAYVQFTLDMKSPTLLAAHLEAFRYFGGIPAESLYDNMKTAWLNRGGVWEVNPALLEFASLCGFAPKRCKVRRPQTKGKVERFIGYLGNHFLPLARTMNIGRLEDLNLAVNTWLDEINDEPIRSFCETRNERFNREAAFLKPFIPEAAPDIRASENVVVSREGTIRFETNVYSVPAKYLGATLTLKYHPISREAVLLSGSLVLRYFDLLARGSKSRRILESDRKELLALWLKQNRSEKKTVANPPKADVSVDVEVRPSSWYDALHAEVAV